MILIKNCPICNSIDFAGKIQCVDHTKSKEVFKIVSCETCGFTLTNPRPNNEELPEYYKSDMYISHTNKTDGVFNWIYQKVRAYSIKRKLSLLKTLNKDGTHLDVGCGTGEFLNACKNSGLRTKGIEPSSSARKQAVKNYQLSISKDTNLKQYSDSEFNSISMWHVLEHIPNLNETVAETKRILKPDGKIIIAVPNHNSWDAKYYKEYWAAWDVPIHLWHFSKNTINKLFKKHDFRMIKTKPMIFDSFYVSLLSEEFISGRKNFLLGLIIGLISNVIGVFTKKGHSSTVYIFEKSKKHI